MIKRSPNLASGLLVMMIVLMIPAISISQEKSQAVSEQTDAKTDTKEVGELSLDELKAKRATAEASGDLGESVKKTVLNLLDKAIRFRQQESQLNKSTEEIAQKAQSAPQRIKEIEAALDRVQAAPESIETVASSMDPSQLEQQIQKVEADLSTAKTNLNKLTDLLKEQENRPEQLRQEIARAKERLVKIEEELKTPASTDESALVVEAQRLALLAEQDKCQVEIKSYEQQLVNYDALVPLLTAERDLAAREVARNEALNNLWQAKAQRLRELEAKKERVEAEQAKELAADLPPEIQKQFDINIKLGKMLEDVTGEEAALTEKLERKQLQLKDIEEEFALAREQVKYPVDTEAIGLALREQRHALPSIQNYKRDSAQRQVLMGEIRAHQLDLDRRRRDLADLNQAVDKVIQTVGALPETEIENLKDELRQLLSDRRDLLKKLQTTMRRYFKKIQSLEFIEQQIATKAEEEASFLDGHLLWIRSAKVFGSNELKNLPKAVKWIINPLNWWQVLRDLQWSFQRNPVLWILGLLLAAGLIGGRRWARQNISRVAPLVRSARTDNFVMTLRALLLTTWLAFGWPFLMGFVAWQLLNLPFAQDFTRAAGTGLTSAARTLATLGFLYELCRKEGIADIHFNWPEGVRRTLRRNLFWLTQLVVPLAFIMITVKTQNEAVISDSLGRLSLMLFQLALSIFVARVLRFSGAIFSNLMRRRRESWLVRLRWLWYPLAIGIPLLLAVLAAMGYYYSALALNMRIGPTVWLVLALIIINALVIRWLFIAKRRLALEEVRRKREALRAQHPEGQAPGGSGDDSVHVEEPKIGLAQIDEQNRALLRTVMLFSAILGVWAIWSEVLPALNILQHVHLWNYRAEVDGVTKTLPITLSNLITGIVVAAVTFVAARNIPGVLEITFLKRLPMDFGARHAFTTICRYVIIAVGFIMAFNAIGVNWSSLQWMVAALSVGLGFGLQEIVANFISGLIILFERPYRVGDFITVGDVNGTVSRIRIRATTIVDRNRRELIVPNKDFITGQLINWSLSDPITRLIVPVGIAYGSDTALAEKLLLKVAAENPEVLKDPAPSAFFIGFGDSCLNFELRVFHKDPTTRRRLSHAVHRAIDDEFRQAKIEISFPQRDVHLDQNGPLAVRVVTE